jgi:serine/threonine-protein kinase
MGEVYEGVHLQLDRPVAIKVLHGDLSDNEAFVTRFAREARTAARLEHPNAVHIYDFGALESGAAYLVMEFIEGATLREVIRRNGRFSLPTALEMLRQAASAVGAAHARGIVHRDLKPENMMVRRDDAGGASLKVVDFGLAKMLEGQTSSLTNRSELIGTPKSMAPEQFSGAKAHERVDVSALGCVYFEMLAGRAPYEGTLIEIVGKHVYAEVPALASFDVDVPEPIEAVVRRALEKDPANRIASAAELVRELEEAAGPEVANAAPMPLAIPERSAFVSGSGDTPSELPTRRAPVARDVAAGTETRYADDARDAETRLRADDPPTVLVPGHGGDEDSEAVTTPMTIARMTSAASLPSGAGGEKEILRPASARKMTVAVLGALVLAGVTATGFWSTQPSGEAPTAEPTAAPTAAPTAEPAIVTQPTEPAIAPPAAEPPAEPPTPSEAATPAPPAQPRAAKRQPAKKRSSSVGQEDEFNFDGGSGENVVVHVPPGLSPQQAREFRRAMRQLEIKRRAAEKRQREIPRPPEPDPDPDEP